MKNRLTRAAYNLQMMNYSLVRFALFDSPQFECRGGDKEVETSTLQSHNPLVLIWKPTDEHPQITAKLDQGPTVTYEMPFKNVHF